MIEKIEQLDGNNRKHKLLKKQLYIFYLLFLLWFFGNCNVIAKTGTQGDYPVYLQWWKNISTGGNPYDVNIPYGPLHSQLSNLITYGDLAPKYFMFTFFSIGIFFLIRNILLKAPSYKVIFIIIFLFPLNFYVINMTSIYGENDTIIAGLMCFVLLAKFSNRSILAGFLFGLLLLFKMTPILLVIFLGIEKNRINIKFVLTSIAVTVWGYGITMINYGVFKVLHSIVQSAQVTSSMLTPLESLRFLYYEHPKEYSSHFPLLYIKYLTHTLILFDPIFVIAVSALFALIYVRCSLDWQKITPVAFLCIICTYSMVNPQYFLSWIIFLIGILVYPDCIKLVINYLPIVFFLEIYQFGFFVTHSYSTSFSFLYHNGGLFFFPIMIFTTLRALCILDMNQLKKLRKYLIL